MSSASAYSLEFPSVRQWKTKTSFPYADPPGLVAREQSACAFLKRVFLGYVYAAALLIFIFPCFCMKGCHW
ncbi:hypothetical protein [Alteribacillus sp. YIM 98480]|uniref:hypothetical protein n=1 Tax=Alteribacillus sp. YIM 98480 TaxID=2606599 RepID=UPI00131C06D1|nr:hypothetical protein [Alteribacillus sp. YIM 98480]